MSKYLGAEENIDCSQTAMCVQRNIVVRSRNHCCHGKEIIITHSECVFVALVIQYAKRMRHIILPYAVCPVLPYFSTLFHQRCDFRKKVTEYWTCVFVVSTVFTWSTVYLILRTIQTGATINVLKSSSKVPVIVVRVQYNVRLNDRFSTNPQTLIFMKICPVGTALFRADRRMAGRTEGQTHGQRGRS
jgi:predicted transcriptional regulator